MQWDDKGRIIVQRTDGRDDANTFIAKNAAGEDSITFLGDGSADFAGAVKSGNPTSTGDSTGVNIDGPFGEVAVFKGAGSSDYGFRIFNQTSNTNVTTLNGDGSATFAGSANFYGQLLQVSRNNTPNNGVFLDAGDLGASNRPKIELKGAGSTGLTSVAFQVAYNNGGNVAYTIDYNGNAAFRNAIFNLEPDNPANYTTTTDAEGNETQVYNGPTLDVKEKLMEALETIEELKTRIAALEA